jgi:hypothetical protein
MNELRPRLVLQAVAGDRCALDVSEPYWRSYAASVGADYAAHHTPDEPTNPCAPKLWLDFYAQKYAQTLWVDADVLPMSDAPDVFDAVPAGHLGVYENAHLARQHPENNPLDGVANLFPHGYFHAGVMVWPSVAAGLMLESFNAMDRRDRPLDTLPKSLWYYEQTALNLAWSKSGIPLHRLDYRFNAYLENAYIAEQFPNEPTLYALEDCWFVHFAGGAHLRLDDNDYDPCTTQQGRAAGMRRWIGSRP